MSGSIHLVPVLLATAVMTHMNRDSEYDKGVIQERPPYPLACMARRPLW